MYIMHLIISCTEYSQILECVSVFVRARPRARICKYLNLGYTEIYSLIIIHGTRHRTMVNRE
jgi:hypothetical protein